MIYVGFFIGLFLSEQLNVIPLGLEPRTLPIKSGCSTN
jgi:hypothetical protein